MSFYGLLHDKNLRKHSRVFGGISNSFDGVVFQRFPHHLRQLFTWKGKFLGGMAHIFE